MLAHEPSSLDQIRDCSYAHAVLVQLLEVYQLRVLPFSRLVWV